MKQSVRNLLTVGVLLVSFAVYGENDVTILKNINLVDVVHKQIIPKTDLIIKGNRIYQIGQKEDSVYQNATRVDMSGKYAIPGLIDAHLHIANDPKESRADRVKVLHYLLAHGITSIRDAAGDARILAELKRAVATGEIQGPDIYYAAFIAGPAYFEGNDREKDMLIGLTTPFAPWLQCIKPGDNLDSAMVAAKACGATGVKIYAGFEKEFLKQVVEKAQQYGLMVWGHATLFPAKPSEVAEAGMKVISHAYMLEWENVKEPLDGNMFKNYEKFYDKIDHQKLNAESFFKQVKLHQSIFDPTLYLCMVNQMEWSANLVKEAHQAGVKICAGTDYISDLNRELPFLFDELDLYVEKCGFTPMDAICSATLIAAEALGIDEQKGSLEVGKKADIVILNSNPLLDMKQLKNIHSVIKDGKNI
ncbi:MAG: amidohydrolase family protein [Odoribacter sp.]